MFALSPRAPGAKGAERAEFGHALDIAAAGAAVWTVAAAATALFSYSSVSYIPITLDDAYGQGLGVYLTQTEPGRAWLITTLVGAALTVLCFAVRNVTALGFVVALAVLGLVPLAREGHAGDTASHDAAVTAIWLHVLFAGFWLGGLATITLLRVRWAGAGKAGTDRLAAVLPRYSTIALICFIVVAASGYVSASIRVVTLENLLTPYGVLVLVKVAALGALGLFGAYQRRDPDRSCHAGRHATVVLDPRGRRTGIHGRRVGGRCGARAHRPPVGGGPDDRAARPDAGRAAHRPRAPARADAGRLADPVEPRPAVDAGLRVRHRSSTSPECGGCTVAATAGRGTARRSGSRGSLVLFWVTNGPINVYERYLFSAHMLGHMLLGMAVPVLLVLSAPDDAGPADDPQARRRIARRPRVDHARRALPGRGRR